MYNFDTNSMQMKKKEEEKKYLERGRGKRRGCSSRHGNSGSGNSPSGLGHIGVKGMFNEMRPAYGGPLFIHTVQD